MDKQIDSQKFMLFMINQEYIKEKRKMIEIWGSNAPFLSLEEFTEQNNLYEDE